jgi:hypothetical protein
MVERNDCLIFTNGERVTVIEIYHGRNVSLQVKNLGQATWLVGEDAIRHLEEQCKLYAAALAHIKEYQNTRPALVEPKVVDITRK